MTPQQTRKLDALRAESKFHFCECCGRECPLEEIATRKPPPRDLAKKHGQHVRNGSGRGGKNGVSNSRTWSLHHPEPRTAKALGLSSVLTASIDRRAQEIVKTVWVCGVCHPILDWIQAQGLTDRDRQLEIGRTLVLRGLDLIVVA